MSAKQAMAIRQAARKKGKELTTLKAKAAWKDPEVQKKNASVNAKRKEAAAKKAQADESTDDGGDETPEGDEDSDRLDAQKPATRSGHGRKKREG